MPIVKDVTERNVHAALRREADSILRARFMKCVAIVNVDFRNAIVVRDEQIGVASAAQVAQMVPDPIAPALLAHCYNEFSFLSRFLPSLFGAENRATHAVALPW